MKMDIRLLLFSIGAASILGLQSRGAVFYVDASSTAPTPPYTNWATAAVTFQDAINVASAGDEVLVTNGIYSTGGKVVHPDIRGNLTNRVAVDKSIVVRSVNGPAVTAIVGDSLSGLNPVRGVYLTNGATLDGFTVTNGATFTTLGQNLNFEQRIHLASGGGILCEDTTAVVTNCVIVGNSADIAFVGMGGGVYSGSLHNCILSNNQAVIGGAANGSILLDSVLAANRATDPLAFGSAVTMYGGGAANCTLTNCTVVGNRSDGHGSGAALSTLRDCSILRDVARGFGGGTYSSTLDGCVLSQNNALEGGGAYFGTLNQCTVASNSATFGGGVRNAAANACVLTANQALLEGGGAFSSTLTNCALLNNSAVTNAGGAFQSQLNHCTITANQARSGGGVSASTLTNCIVLFNSASQASNYDGASMLDHCCATPLPTNGIGNINADPLLADLFHLSSASPCRGAGSAAFTSGVDIDGDPWESSPSIGCDEFNTASATGALFAMIQSDYANATPGFSLNFTAQINGRANACVWNFGDGTIITNEPCVGHSWAATGKYAVTLTAYNLANPGGITVTQMFTVIDQPTQYVSLTSTNPLSPFTSWATAATNIQDAVDEAFGGGSLIIVSNGVYRMGGRAVWGILTNRVAIAKPIIVQSVNGPAVTVIEGDQVTGALNGDGDAAVRCAYVADGATLSGFTLINGGTRSWYNIYTKVEHSGGGALCASLGAILTNCIVVSNTCLARGAGVCGGTLENSTISSNTLVIYGSIGGGSGVALAIALDCVLQGNQTPTILNGGAANLCTLSNCVVTGNVDEGAIQCVLKNCIVNGNSSTGMSGGAASDCEISSNSSSSFLLGGGATAATLTNCFVFGNTAPDGGGVLNCTLIGCTVSNNLAGQFGGGVYYDQQFTNWFGQSNIVVGNSASNSGGGFYFSGLAGRLLTNWMFVSNSTPIDGGGLYASAALSVSECSFLGNSAGRNGGGLISTITPLLNCSNSTFSSNFAGASGGGAFSAALNNCSVLANRAVTGGGVYGSVRSSIVNSNTASGNGGGVYFSDTPKVYENSTFSSNQAGNGGALYAQVMNVTFSNCVFSGNSASTNGGAFHGGISSATLRDCALSGNGAALGGGGYGGAYANCTVVGNNATNSGGGLYLFSSPFLTTNCVILSNTAVVLGGGISGNGGNVGGCVISENSSDGNGGGAVNVSLTRCIINGNRAGTNGGGAFNSTLTTCLLAGNAAQIGGGAYGGSLNSCTVANNTATNDSGGVYFPSVGSVPNSIVYFNSAPANPNYSSFVRFNYSCTYPMPLGSVNVTNEPAFVDLMGGNFRLSALSPCVDAGSGTTGSIDLDGRPRIVNGHIDMGTYEFQTSVPGEFIRWLQQFGLPTDGSADSTDSDADLMNNRDEWQSGTNPTNTLSVLKMCPLTNNILGLIVSWQTVTNRTYFLQRSADLRSLPPFLTIQSNIIGQAGTTSFADTNAVGNGPFFYRVGVE